MPVLLGHPEGPLEQAGVLWWPFSWTPGTVCHLLSLSPSCKPLMQGSLGAAGSRGGEGKSAVTAPSWGHGA